MANITPATELDFDQIKSDMISYIKKNRAFTDYNFEGSALNAIMDILSYNTNTNAYYGNMVHNESFLETAQKRESVVSKAKERGYVPRSCVCSNAFIDITVSGVSSSTSSVYLPRGIQFTSSNDSGSFSFFTKEDYVSTIIGTDHVFKDVNLVNGVRVQNYFTVDSTSNVRSIFSIPNQNIDTSTLKVYIRDSLSSISRTELFLSKSTYNLNPTSKVFFLQEAYDGRYQIYFGQDILGIQPVDGMIIEVDYFLTEDYNISDGCKYFGFDGTIGDSQSITISTTQQSFGGSYKEDIESIKTNAVISNSAKNCALTVDDYSILLKDSFNFIKSVSVWGGEDNDPPVYGKIFISIQPSSGYILSDTVKNDLITPLIKKNSVLTTSPVYVDPSYFSIEFVTKVKFDPTKTQRTKSEVELTILNSIETYINSIGTFDNNYYDSVLIGKIQSSDPGIVSTSLTKKIGFRMTPFILTDTKFSKSINNSIVKGSIQSTKFNYFTDSIVQVVIKEIESSYTLVKNSSGVYQTISKLGLFDTNNNLIKEIGTVNLDSGKFDIIYRVHSYITDNRFVDIRCSLNDADIICKRNQILTLDTDGEDSLIGLSPDNKVIIEIVK